MSTSYCNQALYNAYSSINENERRCLSALAEDWKNKKLLLGKKILLNCHITLSTLIIIDLLLLAGATVKVTATKDLVVHKQILPILEESGITYYSEIDKIPIEENKFYYDIIFDCGAGLVKKVAPIVGSVELTSTNDSVYQQLKYPTITIDKTDAKNIETSFGTGDGFIRGLIENIKNNYSALFSNKILSIFSQNKSSTKSAAHNILFSQNIENLLFQNKQYMVYGYGKVGRGIANGLVRVGSKPNDIIIIDPSEKACSEAKFKQHRAIILNSANILAIKEQFAKTFCIVTATGQVGAVSKYFRREDIPARVLLANMGTPDEWGDEFSIDDVLNHKKPLNFILEYPTQMKFLDPIFKLLLLGSEYLLNSKLIAGLHSLDKKIDTKVLTEWSQYYHTTV